ncbi:MAG: hypothetical protein H5T83_13415 [Actinotalea sp.]|nr:hypothetical protein [Actinotalea sp.]
MNTRRLICLVAAHRYRKVHHPDSDAPGEYFLLCRRCGYRRGVPGPEEIASAYSTWTFGS